MSKQPPLVRIVVDYHQDGSLSVHGPIDDKPWMIAALQHAVDAVRNQGRPKSDIIVPSKDVQLQ